MTGPYTGGCACRAIRFEATTDPVFSNHCQCLDCQAESGTGHSSYLTFPRTGAAVTGEAKRWDMTGDSGNLKTRHFCPTCGVSVYLTFSAMPDLITIRATSLDEPERFAPQVVTYAMRGHAWDCLDPALPKFEKMPG